LSKNNDNTHNHNFDRVLYDITNVHLIDLSSFVQRKKKKHSLCLTSVVLWKTQSKLAIKSGVNS